MLRSNGSVSSEFRWPDPNRTDAPHDVLTDEGVRFDDKGHADKSQRLSPSDLAALIGVDVPEESIGHGDEQRFWVQLNANQPPQIPDAVVRLLDDWRARGGMLSWGGGAQVSCFPIVTVNGSDEYWPWAIKPTSGTVEIVFQHLLTRPPFDDSAVRDELRQRLNRIPGVDIPLSRLELRPSFSLERLTADGALNAAIEVHIWFLDQVAALPNARLTTTRPAGTPTEMI